MASNESIVAAAISEATGGDSGDGYDGGTDDSTVDAGTVEAEAADGADDQNPDAVEGDGDQGAEEERAEDADAEGVQAAEGEVEGEGDPFAKEHGLKEPKQGERENRIPYTHVKRIVGNAETKLAKAVLGLGEKDKLPDGKTPHQAVIDHVSSVNELRQSHQTISDELENVNRVGHMMVHDPEKFQQVLLQLNPEWSKFLRTGADQADTVQVSTEGMPEPDYDLGNGQSTYSPKGLQALLKWHAQSVTTEVLKQVKGEVGKEVKPFKDQRERAEYLQNVVIPRLTARVNHARQNWPGFKENEKEILALVESNPKLSLEDAHITIREKKRDEELATAKKTQGALKKKIITDLRTAPNATSVGSGPTGKTTNANRPQTNEEIVAAAVRAASPR